MSRFSFSWPNCNAATDFKLMQTTVRIIIYLILAVIYFVVPFDFLPDHWGRVGRLDDLLFFFIIIYIFFFKPLIDEILNKKSQKRPGQNAESEFSGTRDPYSILGVSRNAGPEEIRNAYHEKIRQYHPDLVDKMGPEIQQVAREKTQLLNSAYETLKKRFE